MGRSLDNSCDVQGCSRGGQRVLIKNDYLPTITTAYVLKDLKSLSCKEESYAFLSLAIRPVLIPTREKEGIVKDSAHIRVTQYPAAPSRVGRANRLTIDLS